MKLRGKKIFHGLSEVAGQGILSVQGIKHNGGDAKMVVWEENPFYPTHDVNLNINKKKRILFPFYIIKLLLVLLKAIREFDVFHFHFGRSFLLNHDLWLLKLFSKKIIYEFHGSDLRIMSLHASMDPYSYCHHKEDSKKLNRRNEKIFKKSDLIILHDDELLVDIPEKYHKKVTVVPLRCDLDKIKPSYPSVDAFSRISIVHAPSNSSIKGTPYIEAAVAELEKKYPLDYIRIENLEHDKAMNIYCDADIIVDQLCVGTYGVFAIEGMALGKPVITYINQRMKELLPEDCPIQTANRDNIRSVLETLICDSARRNHLGRAGRSYVEKYHNSNVIGRRLMDIYFSDQPLLKGRQAFQAIAQLSQEKE